MPGEAALSSPVVVNDVVFCTTNIVALHAFSAVDGTALWSVPLGDETGGINGGYGYCLGAAVEGDYVVAGALVSGGNGGVLRVYTLNKGDGETADDGDGPGDNGGDDREVRS
jgi:outer membrane protein assembly factor BamB